MIKCLCKANVQDKYTGVNYEAGNEYLFTKERAEEVLKSIYFEMIAEEPKKEVVEEKPKRVKKSTKK